MASHFYGLHMGPHAETLFRHSKRDLQQRLWLQYNLMRLGERTTSAIGEADRLPGMHIMRPNGHELDQRR